MKFYVHPFWLEIWCCGLLHILEALSNVILYSFPYNRLFYVLIESRVNPSKTIGHTSYCPLLCRGLPNAGNMTIVSRLSKVFAFERKDAQVPTKLIQRRPTRSEPQPMLHFFHLDPIVCSSLGILKDIILVEQSHR